MATAAAGTAAAANQSGRVPCPELFTNPANLQDYPLQPLVDDCRLLGSLLDDCLRIEVGDELFAKVGRKLQPVASRQSQPTTWDAAKPAQRWSTGASFGAPWVCGGAAASTCLSMTA